MKSKINLSQFSTPLIGIDEVGRGCLAGPVVAAAVIFLSDTDTHHYVDSKTIKEAGREKLSDSISQHHLVAVGWASVEEIDQINILQATFLAMHRAVEQLLIKRGLLGHERPTLLIDGRDRVPSLGRFDQVPIIQGDQKVRLISAASIAAKVARDQFMVKLSQTEAVGYGFEKHKGYGTVLHRKQIQELGVSVWHRRTFGGVKEHISK